MRKLLALLALTTFGSGFAQTDAPEDLTITLIPGLTTDAFYITMNRGAQAAAEALGITVNFQGAEEFNPDLAGPGFRFDHLAWSGRDSHRPDRQHTAYRAAAKRRRPGGFQS